MCELSIKWRKFAGENIWTESPRGAKLHLIMKTIESIRNT